MQIKPIIKTLWTFLLLLFISQLGWAQACCSGGTPLSSNLGVQSMSKQQISLDLSYDYNTQKTLVRGSEKLDDRFRKRNTHALLLRGKYAFSDRFAVITLLSWLRQEEDNRTLNGSRRLTSAEGLSDIIALLQYQVLSKGPIAVVIAGGAKLPFGKTDVLDPVTDLLLTADLQPSTGALDGLAVLDFTYAGWTRHGLDFSFTTTFRLTSDYDRFDGQQTYRFGNEWQIYSGLRDQYVLGKGLLNPQLMIRYRRTAVDRTDGITTPNTGGQWIHLVPGIQYQFSNTTGFNLSGEIPLYRQLTGVQLTTSYRFNLGFSYRFN